MNIPNRTDGARASASVSTRSERREVEPCCRQHALVTETALGSQYISARGASKNDDVTRSGLDVDDKGDNTAGDGIADQPEEGSSFTQSNSMLNDNDGNETDSEPANCDYDGDAVSVDDRVDCLSAEPFEIGGENSPPSHDEIRSFGNEDDGDGRSFDTD